MDYAKSTRFSIVEQGLADVLERLNEMPASPRVRELRTKAMTYERAYKSWDTHAPSEEQRATLTRSVLDLNVEVIALGRETKDVP
ncbi:MAG: hypothetical protein JWM74_1822 [Myxococcaceae bacterium]|nr:hypothetical protein [Myxococcaceae bacterium]